MNNANSPAMPHTEYDKNGNLPKGLTKHEYFASVAMTSPCNPVNSNDHRGRAQWALADAYALLEELESVK